MGPKDNQPTLATVMVSHHWRNLFCDLIAAIVAFALGDTSYEAVAAELHEHKFEELRLRLDRRDALEMSFWGCLFCVNQHAGICGSFAPEPLPDQKDYKVAHAEWTQNTRDPVTGEAFPICRCTHAKNWNDSNDCEMDKFDAMMAVLHEEAPRVAQRCHHMIVVDRHFEVFSRICVMAEIAKGQELELTQHAMLFSGVDELLDSEVGSWVCAGGGGAFAVGRGGGVMSPREAHQLARPRDDARRSALRRTGRWTAEFPNNCRSSSLGGIFGVTSWHPPPNSHIVGQSGGTSTKVGPMSNIFG